MENPHLYSYLAEDMVELFNTFNKFNILASINLVSVELLIVRKMRMNAIEESNEIINS